VGAGPSKTIITAPPLKAKRPCWTDSTDIANLRNVSALFFMNPKGPVKVTGLKTVGHTGNGIAAYGARGFTVTHTIGKGHGAYGVLASGRTTGIKFLYNLELNDEHAPGEGGTAGLSVGDTPNAAAVIANNKVLGWHLGVFAREARHGAIVNNVVRGNCVGVLVFDDNQTESVQPPANYLGGDWKVVGNESIANNRRCLTRGGYVSGNGIIVVNADKVLVADNLIKGNHSSGPTDFPLPKDSGYRGAGLAVVHTPPFVPPTPPTREPHNVLSVGNTFENNELDIFYDGSGSGIRFVNNDCSTSLPQEICA
jgi:hypothetical protein